MWEISHMYCVFLHKDIFYINWKANSLRVMKIHLLLWIGIGLTRSGCACAIGVGGPFPPMWLFATGGVCGRPLSRGDIQRRLFGTPCIFGSPGLLCLFWGPDTNSSASSIIIPCNLMGRILKLYTKTTLYNILWILWCYNDVYHVWGSNVQDSIMYWIPEC